MAEIDVKKSPETIRFADGGRNENNVYIQNYDGYRLAVVRDSDGKEAEIEAEDIGNLIKALEQAKEYFGDGLLHNPDLVASDWTPEIGAIYRQEFRWEKGREWRGPIEKVGNGWIRHDSGDCPVHPMDVVEAKDEHGDTYITPPSKIEWLNYADCFFVTHYRPIHDEDGVPYVSNEGLEPWAEYVATDDDGDVNQYSGCPTDRVVYSMWWPDVNDKIEKAPRRYSNTFQHWTETLRRVRRK